MPYANQLIDNKEMAEKINKYSRLCINDCYIQPQMYIEHKVNRGLRDSNGKGVLTGLTEVSEINSKKIVDVYCGIDEWSTV